MFSEQEQNEILRDFMAELPAVIAAETVTDPGSEKIHNAVCQILDLGQKYGFRTGRIGALCGWLECGSGEKMIAVLCHLDVVPPGDLSAWHTPPFTMVEKDGCIYGRGVKDNKGPMILTFSILKKMLEKNVPLKKRVRLLFGTEEETGCGCIRRYAESGELPEYAFTPDCDYPLIAGEKGILHFEIGKTFAPGSNPVSAVSGGSIINAVPGAAEAVCGGAVLKAEGYAAHASTPDDGENAILKLGGMLPDGTELKQLLACLNKKDLNIDLRDEYSELTFVPSIISGSADSVKISCDIRFPVTMKGSEIVQRIRTVLESPDLNCSVTVLEIQEPLFHHPDSKLVKTLLGVYRNVTGNSTAEPVITGGGTYAKALPSTVAFGMSFPGEEKIAHKANERWAISSIRKNINIVAEAILALNNL